MNELEWFGWLIAAMSLVTVIIWGLVLLMVCQGAWELLRDAWRAVRRKA